MSYVIIVVRPMKRQVIFPQTKEQTKRRDSLNQNGTLQTNGINHKKKWVLPKIKNSFGLICGIFFFNFKMFRRKERNESEVLKELNELQEAAAEVEKRPRMSGSLIQNPHDDITTRIKNIEHIEIGKHRLRYFFQFFGLGLFCFAFNMGQKLKQICAYTQPAPFFENFYKF